MHIWLDGEFIDSASAKISVFDAGFQHGVGLFETMLARNGRIFRVDAHMRRLAGSAGELRLSKRLRPAHLAEAAQLTVQRNEMESARVRLTVTGGDLNLLQSAGRTQQDPTILIVAQPPTPYPDAFFEKGVSAVIADERSNPLSPMAGHKTLNYWPRIQALQQAAGKGAGEALWFTVSNHLASGSVSNVFLIKDGELLTPIARGEEEVGALPAPVLPGITRGVIIELAEDLGLAVSRRTLDINDLLGADEVFLTNSSWGVLPVIGVEKEKIAEGAVGEITGNLRRGWLRTVEEETV
jgi:branched-subunit amino acid aminotransferase/4-amino-4-deoxychorismate lyase